MMTRNAYALNSGFLRSASRPRPTRVALLEANMGGDKKPTHRYFERGGHGKTVIAEATLSARTLRRVLRTNAEDVLALERMGVHGSIASGMQSSAFTPASAVAAVFAATGQDLGMVGTSSMAHGTVTPTDDGGVHVALRWPASRSARSAAAPRSRMPERGSRARLPGRGRRVPPGPDRGRCGRLPGVGGRLDGHGGLGQLRRGPPRTWRV